MLEQKKNDRLIYCVVITCRLFRRAEAQRENTYDKDDNGNTEWICYAIHVILHYVVRVFVSLNNREALLLNFSVNIKRI